LFAAHILLYQQQCDGVDVSLRQWICFGFIVAWGARLSYNFWRKGGYKAGGEDYRWAYIRKHYPRLLVEFLNLFFTAYYQVFLIYLFTASIKYAYTPEINFTDYICIAAWILLFVGEVVADEQQWNFQTKKHQLLKTKKI
jgi:steroid 5-alpha reductase family enzyme